jgi:predicted anti-sigma-YlaC factor YlaD
VVDRQECERIRELFTAAIDRASSEIEEASVRRHLRSCAECAEAYDAHRAVARGLAQQPLVRPRSHPLPPHVRFRSQLYAVAGLAVAGGAVALVVLAR